MSFHLSENISSYSNVLHCTLNWSENSLIGGLMLFAQLLRGQNNGFKMSQTVFIESAEWWRRYFQPEKNCNDFIIEKLSDHKLSKLNMTTYILTRLLHLLLYYRLETYLPALLKYFQMKKCHVWSKGTSTLKPLKKNSIFFQNIITLHLGTIYYFHCILLCEI